MYPRWIKYRAIVHYCEFQRSLRKVATRYGIGKSTLARWVRERDRPLPPKRRRRSRASDHIASVVCEALQTNPFATASDLIQVVHQRCGMKVSSSTIYRCLRGQKYTVKRAQRSREHETVDIRHAFFARSASPYGSDAISIDESSFCMNDRPLRGWAPRGQRVPKGRPGRRSRVSLLLAIGYEGTIAHRTVFGGVNGRIFAEFVNELPDGRPLIIDNASIHKTRGVCDALAAKGISAMFTPPYSPWFNPVEFTFAWLKRAFRMAGQHAHVTAVGPDARSLVDRVNASVHRLGDTSGHFEHCERVWDETVRSVRQAVCK